MLLAPEVEAFVAWFAALQGRIEAVVRELCTPFTAPSTLAGLGGEASGIRELPATSATGEGGDAMATEWGQWLDASAHPELLALREWTARSRTRLRHDHPIAAFAAELRAGIDVLPEHLVLRPLPVDAEDRAAAQGEAIPLRRWLQLGFAVEVVPELERLEQALVAGLSDIEGRIDELERVLDYYTLAVRRHAADVDDPAQAQEVAHTGLARVRALIADLHRHRVAWARRALGRFVDRTAGALEDAVEPFRTHRTLALRGRLEALERLERAGPPPPNVAQRTWSRAKRGYRAALPFARQLGAELHAVLTEQEPEPLRRAYRSLIATDPEALGAELPPSYRRLFAAVPIELADLYIHRPELEEACAAAVATWSAGAPQAILLHGDRGVGKRTLVNHVLSRVSSRASLDVRWIRLGPCLCEEPDVARVLARALGWRAGAAVGFADLARPRGHAERHRAIVVENAERLLSPSPAGIARLAAFLSMVGETAVDTLWILLMATPAATLVLHRLELANRVPTVLHVPPMDEIDSARDDRRASPPLGIRARVRTPHRAPARSGARPGRQLSRRTLARRCVHDPARAHDRGQPAPGALLLARFHAAPRAAGRAAGGAPAARDHRRAATAAHARPAARAGALGPARQPRPRRAASGARRDRRRRGGRSQGAVGARLRGQEPRAVPPLDAAPHHRPSAAHGAAGRQHDLRSSP
jgi:hypothetical protein